MESQWIEVQQVCDTNLNKVSPVSALCWDPYHELLWVGNDSVRKKKKKEPALFSYAIMNNLGKSCILLWKRSFTLYVFQNA